MDLGNEIETSTTDAMKVPAALVATSLVAGGALFWAISSGGFAGGFVSGAIVGAIVGAVLIVALGHRVIAMQSSD